MNVLNCSGYEIYNQSIKYVDGCYIYDDNNRRYLDFESGVWTLSLGHNNKRINEKINKQIQSIMHTGYRYSNPIVEETASKLLQLMNLENGKCLFLSSGSEAVEFCMKVAKKIMNKKKILSLQNHYLSAYGSASNSEEQDNWITLDWQANINLLNDENDLSILNSIDFSEIGAFVFEPGNASGIVKIPPTNLITKIVKKVKENNGYIIVDEVTTGFGRTGKWFGYEHYDIQPDMIACGKGMGNGYPISVVGLSNMVVDAIETSNFTYAQSHQNDPLGCAVAFEVIEEIKEKQY